MKANSMAARKEGSLSKKGRKEKKAQLPEGDQQLVGKRGINGTGEWKHRDTEPAPALGSNRPKEKR